MYSFADENDGYLHHQGFRLFVTGMLIWFVGFIVAVYFGNPSPVWMIGTPAALVGRLGFLTLMEIKYLKHLGGLLVCGGLVVDLLGCVMLTYLGSLSSVLYVTAILLVLFGVLVTGYGVVVCERRWSPH